MNNEFFGLPELFQPLLFLKTNECPLNINEWLEDAFPTEVVPF